MTSIAFENNIEFAKNRDNHDILKKYASQFNVPTFEAQQAYFCGHSLGPPLKKTQDYLSSVFERWSSKGVAGYFDETQGWLNWHRSILGSLSRLVGARSEEVAIMNSLTANLHFMLASFYQPTPNRHKVLIEKNAFPSDKFALSSHIELKGFNAVKSIIWLEPRARNSQLKTEEIIETIQKNHESLALVLLPSVQFYTGQVLDIGKIAKTANEYGICIGIDAAHAVGNIPLELHAWQVDFAVWCHYKYLNSGPGAPAGAFIHQRHHAKSLPRMAGWWGQEQASQFDMGGNFKPAQDALGWQLSCPPILSLAPLMASLELYEEVGLKALREKSLALTGYLAFLLKEMCPALDIITPLTPQARGAQLSLKIGSRASQLCEQLKIKGYYCDYRNPDILRVAPSPWYNTFEQVYDFCSTLKALTGDVYAIV